VWGEGGILWYNGLTMTTRIAPVELPPGHIEKLRRHLSAEIVRAVGLSADGPLSRPVDWLFRVPTGRFAEVGARFDAWVRQLGFAEAARQILPVFVRGYEAVGNDHIPADGPLLIASNHPGAYDALVIAASVDRDDIKIVAGDIPFLMNLPSASDHFIFATRDPHQRMGVLRTAIRHLRDGGSLLIFPSGHIDPDPAVLPGAWDALHDWSRSVEVMLRRAPDTRVLVTIVSGVLARACTRSPLTRLRKRPRDRQRIAEFIQVIQQMVRERSYALVPDISFAEPLTSERLRIAHGAGEAMDALVHAAEQLFARHADRVFA